MLNQYFFSSSVRYKALVVPQHQTVQQKTAIKIKSKRHNSESTVLQNLAIKTNRLIVSIASDLLHFERLIAYQSFVICYHDCTLNMIVELLASTSFFFVKIWHQTTTNNYFFLYFIYLFHLRSYLQYSLTDTYTHNTQWTSLIKRMFSFTVITTHYYIRVTLVCNVVAPFLKHNYILFALLG